MKELVLGLLLIETRNHIANTKREVSIKYIYLLFDLAIDVTYTTRLLSALKKCELTIFIELVYTTLKLFSIYFVFNWICILCIKQIIKLFGLFGKKFGRVKNSRKTRQIHIFFDYNYLCGSIFAIDSLQLLYHEPLSFHQRYHIIILHLHFQLFTWGTCFYLIVKMLARAVRARSMLRGLSTIAACTCNRHAQNSMLNYFNEVRLLRFRGAVSVMQTQRFYSKNSDHEDDMMAEGESELLLPDRDSQLPATVAVPDVWPHVPMLAMRRNPLFPRFMKIVEVGGDRSVLL